MDSTAETDRTGDRRGRCPHTPRRTASPSEPGDAKVNGANQAAAGQRSQVPRSSLDFQTWQQHSRTDTLKALLRLNHFVFLEKMTEKHTSGKTRLNTAF